MGTIEAMVEAGMNFARLNFAHGTYDSHAILINRLRAVEKKTGEPLAILQDLQGPRIRIGSLRSGGITVKTNQEVFFNTAKKKFISGEIPVDHPELHKFLRKRQRILVDDGRIEFVVTEVNGSKITAKVVQEGVIHSHKGINLPDSLIKLPALSQKDRRDLRFGIKMGVDAIGLSFVSSAKDIKEARLLINEILEAEKIPLRPIAIIAKIETKEAIKNIRSIIIASDGVMVARGDLGLELPTGEVPVIQKKIIDEANRQAKPVIVATQLLNSMQTSRRPTRAEASDVANAVIDHADALLLTNETANGAFPILAVKTMTDIIISTEKSVYDDIALPPLHFRGLPIDGAIADTVKLLSDEVTIAAVVTATKRGLTARLLSHVRPLPMVIVGTENQDTSRQLSLSWGIKPVVMTPFPLNTKELQERLILYIKDEKIAKKGQKIIVVAGEPIGLAEHVSTVEVRTI
ncbi:MAG: pyruvate kinase [Candidatus Magasanikbacteria bacterium RIFCSPHIGHO2_02_FULL_45_10]|uniref:Pyruvate kinase n=1 Tax=Candidatus Magasanikbacteria bacterium RIFCSPHIGHO2_02_FULL_45_10 TaxID=1798679 RepID=A0A1F6MBH2_9BACT|nr:MAG: pyruvate kinase [Candidatus Magasanikbacteria bacterium RIFCSPHIGHO2_02_FULL_45_10]